MAPLEQFILFGDSITQGSHEQLRGFGMGAELQAAYIRRFDVINRGYSGYNTKNAVKVLPHVIPTPEQASVKFMTIWFGANDANKELTHNQYVPIENFKSNLVSIATHPLVKAHSPNIILITNPPFEETVLWQTMEELKWGGESRKQKDAKAYAEAVKEVGRELGVPVVDAWSAFMEKAGWKVGDEVLVGTKESGKSEVLEELLYDGLHLSPEGYRVVFDELLKVLREKWPEYPPYKMPFTVKLPWEMEMGDAFWDISG